MPEKLVQGWRALLERIQEIVLKKDFEYAELQGGLVSVLWGIWFITLADKIDAQHMASYVTLMRFADHAVWGALFLILGLAQIYGLIRQVYRVRRTTSLFAVVVWLYVTILFGLEDWHALVFPTTAAFAVGAAWGFIRIGRMVPARKETASRSREDRPGILETPPRAFFMGGTRM